MRTLSALIFALRKNLLWKEISCWNNGRDQKPKLFRKRIFPECCENFRDKSSGEKFPFEDESRAFPFNGPILQKYVP